MTNKDIYFELPDDPELAFLAIEEGFRRACDVETDKLGMGELPTVCYVRYISKVLAAVVELGLETQFQRPVPRIETIDHQDYPNFVNGVEHYKTQLRIRHARREKSFSVRFDPATKAKIRHHLDRIRTIVDQIEVTEKKREALIEKINALYKEVDRNRTRYEAFAALAIEAAGTLGDAATTAEPARKWIDSIARLFWGAKEHEAPVALPGPEKRKAIEPPKNSVQSLEPTSRDLDDEIPF